MAVDLKLERDLLRRIRSAVIVTNDQGIIAFANPAAERLFGWVVSDLVGQLLIVLMPPRMRARHVEGFRLYQETGQSRLMGKSVRVPVLRRDGTEVEIELTLRMFQRPDGSRLVVAHAHDATDLTKAGEGVVELETRLLRRAYHLI